MNVLVLNCGSSSVRFQVIDTDLAAIERDGDRRLAHGRIERVGGHALITLQVGGGPKRIEDAPLRDQRRNTRTGARTSRSSSSACA
jgi:acetate kinase